MGTELQKRGWILTAAAAAVAVGMLGAGCTPEAYRRSADRQVVSLLKDRERRALDYTPQVEVKSEDPPPVARRAFEKIPATVMSPPAPGPIEPPRVDVPFAPLGPAEPMFEGPVPDGGRGESADLDAVRAEAGASLVLGPPAPVAPGVRLDLFGSMRYAVQHSRQYRTRMEDLYVAALDVTLQRYLLGPRPFARGGLEYAGGQGDVNYRSALTATADAGVRQRLPYGGEVVAQALVRFVDAIGNNAANAEEASAVLSGSIPLLRGAGLVNLEPLIQGERSLVYAVRAFEDFRRGFAVQVASQYFNLLTQQQSVANRVQSYRDRANLLERAQALFEAAVPGAAGGRGSFSFLEVQRARQSMLEAESALLNERNRYQAALDNFKILLGMPVADDLDVAAVELDVDVPEARGGPGALEFAERYRLDVQTARDRIEDARRGVYVAENGLLPDLTLTGRAQLGNRADTPSRALDERTLSYSAGVTLDLPVDRLAERNAYRRSLITLDQARRNLEDLRARVQADVRDSLRRIELAEVQLGIQRRNIELARRRLELANELLRQGRGDTRDVVDAQDALLRAQDAFENAQANLQISVLQFLQQTGTLRIDPDAGSFGRAMTRPDEPRADRLERAAATSSFSPVLKGEGGRDDNETSTPQ